MTYKNDPDNSDIKVQITDEYEREEALQIIKASRLDYQQHFDINLTKS